MVAPLHPAEPMTPANQFLAMLELLADGGMDDQADDYRTTLAELLEQAAQRLRNPSRKEGAA